jgi:RNA polymerase sigma-70 factor (ECF subfamily)
LNPLQADLPKSGQVIPLDGSDARIVAGLRRDESWAADALYDRYAPAIERMLRRTLGYERHADFEDLLHEVFVEALSSAHQLRDSVALLAWLRTIAVRSAIRTIRRRKARSWLRFSRPEELPETETEDPPPEVRQAYASFYDLLSKIPAVEQVVFTLRYVEGMELTELATTCEVSLSTAKRRLWKAESRFARLAQRDPILSHWIVEGSKWAQ